MNRIHPDRFARITARYASLSFALIGDFCLDRYLEIDAGREEISIETGLPVYNVTRVRSQPGGAGTILNNLVALGVGRVYPVGFAGMDGEGFELQRALKALPGVDMEGFLATGERSTFTYTKPLVIQPGQPPRELNRLDIKNWTHTPAGVAKQLRATIEQLAPRVDGFILLDQVDLPETGVVTSTVLETVGRIAQARPEMLILADSRRGLGGFPPLAFKMNRAEFARMTGTAAEGKIAQLEHQARELAVRHQRPVFVTLAEEGILGAAPDGEVAHVPAWPVRGPIDIVGAGDSVTANLAAALTAGASLKEAIELASAAASIVIHQLGTTGTASVPQLRALIESSQPAST